MRVPRYLRAAALALTAAVLAGCGLDTSYSVPYPVQPGLIKAEPSLRGVDLTVGSKEFTENVVLGYMAEYALAAAGANVQDLTGIQGTYSARQALTSGQVDLYWDYTGTGWLSFLGHDTAIPGQREQYEAVRKEDLRNGLVWLPYSPVNDTYSFAVNKDFAAQNHLKTLSEVVSYIKKNPDNGTFCVNGEFANRTDGLLGVEKKYGFQVPDNNIVNLSIGTIPAAINGPCKFGVMNSTDGRILANNLIVLQDDKEFFPKYNASIVVLKSILDKYPAVARALAPLAQRLNNKTMLELNEKVDVVGTPAEVVARDWMVQQGLIKYNGKQ